MSRDTIRRFVELNRDDVRWLEETYPNGSLSGILSMLLSAYREVTQMTPKDYALLAAKELGRNDV